MSDTARSGVVYTEYSRSVAAAAVSSLWSFETGSWHAGRQIVSVNASGNREYWLERSDPLLNTILPGTHVSVIVNSGSQWASGRSPATSALVPRACVMGPVSQARILRVGGAVHAVGAVLAPMLAQQVFGVPAAELIDQVVPLDQVWDKDDAERLLDTVLQSDVGIGALRLRNELIERAAPALAPNGLMAMARMIQRRAGRVSVDAMAKAHRLSRQEFARRFRATTGFGPKRFAQLTRFERLVHQLLSTDVADWVSVSSAMGFYDQAHMINDFRRFAGSAPTMFFRPHQDDRPAQPVRISGRPSEWIQRP